MRSGPVGIARSPGTRRLHHRHRANGVDALVSSGPSSPELRWLRYPGLACSLACGWDAPAGGESETPTSTSDAAPAVCGDAVLADDELCDDGNDLPDDGCDRCVPPLQEVWTKRFEGSYSNDHDIARGVAFTPDGRLYLVGCDEVGSQDKDIAVRRLDVDGTLLWERFVVGPAGLVDCASAVAVTPDAGAVVAGELGVEDLDDRPWAARYTDAGELVWTFSNASAAADQLRDVAIQGDAVFTVGYRDTEAQTFEATIRRLDAISGAEVWLRTYGEPTAVATASALALADGELVVVGERVANELPREATIQRWSADGEQLAAWTWNDSKQSMIQVSAVTIQSDGTIVMSALARDSDHGFVGSHLVAFDPDGTLRWVSDFAIDWSSPEAHGLAVDTADRIFAAGDGYHDFARIESVFGLFGANGASLASEQLSGEEVLSEAYDIAVHPTGVAVVGITCDNTTCDQWARKFAFQ